MLDERKYEIFLEMQQHNGIIFTLICSYFLFDYGI
jgi:hypothetical protein